MKYILIFHANLLYSNLPPDRHEFVIRHSYEKIHELFDKKFPQARYMFEAGGWTLERIAELAPDVLEKYKDAFKKNCEFMGSPYGHAILANYPPEDGLKSLELSMETYSRLLGFVPESASNPECGWNKHIPEIYVKAGFGNLLLDWESFLITNYPEVRAVEYDPDRTRKDGKNLPYYPIDPDHQTLHFPVQVAPGLKGVMRSDRICNELLWYFMGQSEEYDGEIPVEAPLSSIDHWSGKKKQGYLIPYAEDAEYCGTTAYFYLKYYNEFRLFEDSPESLVRLEKIVSALLERGELVTVSDVVRDLPTLDIEVKYEDGIAWHRTFADAWASTPWSKEINPLCYELHDKVIKAEKLARTEEEKASVRRAWRYLMLAENSDGRWPPPPLAPADYNIEFCKKNIELCRKELNWLKDSL